LQTTGIFALNFINYFPLKISDHAQLQEQIEQEQTNVQQLSTFMAIVDDHEGADTEQAYNELESQLQNVGKR
jgi:hypothetical protein